MNTYVVARPKYIYVFTNLDLTFQVSKCLIGLELYPLHLAYIYPLQMVGLNKLDMSKDLEAYGLLTRAYLNHCNIDNFDRQG